MATLRPQRRLESFRRRFVVGGLYCGGVHDSCVITSPDTSKVAELAKALAIHEVTARCLVSRGILESSAATTFFRPSLAALRPPIGLAGLPEALVRLVRAAKDGERVGVFGDYDVDGVTSATLLSEAMEAFGIEVVARVASRKAGYGFGQEQAKELVEAGCKLIVTCDCGTSDEDSITLANDAGCEVIVIDHHTVPDADTPHPSLALINPYREDSTFPFRGMASVGLVFYVMGALRTALREAGHFEGRRKMPDMRQWLDLVAMGTVADLVPLRDENRIMTQQGLLSIASRARPGVAALLDVAGVKRSDKVSEHTIGWRMGPRLNAPGRLGDAQASLDLLRAPDEYTAKAAARVVETINVERRTAQDKVFEEAMALLGDSDPGPAVVIAGQDWAHGVVGIIASRLVDKYQRPAVVIALNSESGEGRGSARSFGGVNLYEAMASCKELLGRFGGHAAAAGLSMDGTKVDEFRSAFHNAVESQPQEEIARFQCDAELSIDGLTEKLASELGTMAPFGKGNEEPLLLSCRVTVKSTRRVGDGSHLKLSVVDSTGREISGIAFGLGERDPGAGAVIDIVYTPTMSVYAGRSRLDLGIKEFCLSG